MGSTRFVCRFVSGLIFLMLLPMALAQTSGQSGDSSTSTGSRGDSSRQTSGRSPSDFPRSQRLNNQLLFISGVVVQEDGSPVPMGATIERVCGGRSKREANVDSNGYFSFQIGGTATGGSLLPDASDDSLGVIGASEGRGLSRLGRMTMPETSTVTSLVGCELRAVLGGYRSSTIILDATFTSGPVDVGTIVLRPAAKVEGTTISATSLAAPKTARKALAHANSAIQKKNFEAAENNLLTATGIYPKYAEAWFRLGQVYQHQQRNQDARDSYSKALAADNRYVSPYIQLARIASLEQNWQEVANITDRALALDPLDFPEGYFLNSMAYYSMNKLDIAERSARKALRLDSQHHLPQIHVILADILQGKQDFMGSAEQLRAYLRYAPSATPLTAQVRSRLEQMEKSSQGVEQIANSPIPRK